MAHDKRRIKVGPDFTTGIPMKKKKGGKKKVKFAPIPAPRIISVDPFKEKK